ncbi:receptor-type tyrosine-protein phosphatase C-like [Gadus macrocephalus]|uniref:receptor-type tyrosine-protein phosphatase C-like n=1 Tax=Gadus macrocephalus TaxID=80720 RepID=UPI0028CB4BDC|nr:receptor-type tyrosine-protein phosphatase C-like [Gadus macrocephalus]
MVSSSISLSPLAPSSKERSCEVTGLLPFTLYYCEIQPRFNDKPIGTATKQPSKTSAGVPDTVAIKRPTQVENNAFLVECKPLDQNAWRGPETWYRATITGFKEIKQNNCSFKFRDLSYSTGYTVSIFAFNGVNSGKAGEVRIQTSCISSGVLLRVLVLLGFSVPTLVVLLHLFDWWRTRGNQTATEECIGLNSASDAPPARVHLGPGASDEDQADPDEISDDEATYENLGDPPRCVEDTADHRRPLCHRPPTVKMTNVWTTRAEAGEVVGASLCAVFRCIITD